MATKAKIKKGDEVIVLCGRDKGKKGEVLSRHDDNRLVVRGVNVVKRHQRQTATTQSGIVEKEATIHISNVALIDPKTGKPTRVGYKVLENGDKVRVSRVSGEVLDK